ncbi:hypothetical protein IL54_1703 [Sphingobium sp. ba1]|nr:hypothetical protein IL54_1703 [Sphingobium sp. ba1]
MPTIQLEQAAMAMPSLIAIDDFYPFRGGVPLYHEAHCVGAIAVSGASPDQDEAVARYGAASLTPQD